MASLKKISIHALVKRATLQAVKPAQQASYFNPRPREEGDVSSTAQDTACPHFNPRPREEGDSRYSRPPIRAGHFNPRPREEGDRCFEKSL